MTDIDTTAIRTSTPEAPYQVILELCDALDAARADVTFFRDRSDHWEGQSFSDEGRADAAEARITAALAELEPNRCVRLPKWWIKHMRHLLEGATA